MADAAASPIVLYSYFRSSCSWRVRIALALKNMPYEYRAVNLIAPGGGEQKSEEYVKLNPGRLLPTLLIDGHTLTQSMSILEYLEEAYSSVPLLPKGAFERAEVRSICNMIACDTQPVSNQRVLVYVGEKKAEWAKHWITVNFEGLETVLARTAGRFCYGDSVTLADVCLVPQVYNAYRWGVDMASFPTIDRLYKELNEMPAFVAAHAHTQPDTPADMRQ